MATGDAEYKVIDNGQRIGYTGVVTAGAGFVLNTRSFIASNIRAQFAARNPPCCDK